MRRWKHGLKQHRRHFLRPFTELEKKLKDKMSLQPNEANAFHGVHQLFARATGWDFDSSKDLARHLGVMEAIIAFACGSAMFCRQSSEYSATAFQIALSIPCSCSASISGLPGKRTEWTRGTFKVIHFSEIRLTKNPPRATGSSTLECSRSPVTPASHVEGSEANHSRKAKFCKAAVKAWSRDDQ